MAIVVLVLWLFTAGVGLSLLVTSNHARARPTDPSSAEPASAEPAKPAEPASIETARAEPANPVPASAPAPASAVTQTSALAASASAATPASMVTPPEHASPREARRAARGRFDTASLVAARNAPIVPGLRSLLEFAHPVCALAGLAFWLGFTLVRNRGLGLIAFGLLAVTACAGLTWFTANARAAKAGARAATADTATADTATAGPKPSFSGRLAVLHGGAAAVTVALAALAIL